ncbi:MAG: 4-oxalomesaconate hydratase [Pelagibacterium sp. SCN 64-44]|nr:MAG: 4-oxalomesaconate hydratase [Pelagibacterium sp. SCN 64-44]
MIIDIHGHFTSLQAIKDYRANMVQAWESGDGAAFAAFECPDEDIRDAITSGQLRLQKERGTDLTLFSPIAGDMGHHVGDFELSAFWSRTANDLIARVIGMFPDNFIGVCQLPQSPGADPAQLVPELERCIGMGFVGCNLNPDVSGGYWKSPPLYDRSFYPLYEKMCELDVPAMIHVTGSCNPAAHATGAHYIAGDTIAYMQLVQSDLFRDFPDLRFVIPHGGGAIPFHWGRYRGLAIQLGKGDLGEHLGRNVFFDTCVYHAPGVALMSDVLPVENILFASEMLGAVKCNDPDTGHAFDDTKRYVDALPISAAEKEQIFWRNAVRVYPRIAERVDAIVAARRGPTALPDDQDHKVILQQ